MARTCASCSTALPSLVDVAITRWDESRGHIYYCATCAPAFYGGQGRSAEDVIACGWVVACIGVILAAFIVAMCAGCAGGA